MNNGKDRFAGLLIGYRGRAGFTQQELANKIGVHRRTIDNWETYASRPQSRGQVLRLADELILSIEERKELVKAAGFSVERWPTEVWTVPLSRNIHFTGRDDILQSLHQLLIPGTMTALSGLGGIGKTSLAVEYTHRFHDYYEAILWMQAASKAILTSECVALADELELPERTEEDQTKIVEAVRRWLKKRRNWLLILDNVDDLQMVKAFLPSDHQGKVLITTRAESAEPLAQTLPIPLMSEREGVLFLLRRSGYLTLNALLEQAGPEQCEGAHQIWQLLEGLPLALDQAGAYIRETKCSFASYEKAYQQQQISLLNRRGIFIHHSESVVGTFLLAFQKVEEDSPAAADLLRVCALLYTEDIPETIFRDGSAYLGSGLSAIGTDEHAWNTTIGVILRYSLIHRSVTKCTLSVHRLVQAVIRDAMEENLRKKWSRAALKAVNHVFPLGVFETWANCENLLSQVLVCYTIIEEYGITLQEGVDLLQRAGGYLYMRGRYEQAELLLKKGLEISQKFENPTEMHNLFHILSASYFDQGKYKEAEELCLEILNYQKQTGVEDSGSPALLANLAMIYQEQGKMKEAEIKFQQALEVSQKVWGTEDESADAATIMGNLGALYCELEKYSQAEPLLKKALAIQKQQLGVDHPTVANSLHALGVFYDRQKMYESAEQLYQQALKISQKQLGEDHPKTADTLHNLGMLYKNKKEYDRAEPLLEKALEARRNLIGEGHSRTIASYNDLLELYFEQKKYQEAIHLARESMENRKQQLGEDHPEILTNLNDLGVLYCELKKYREAEPLLEKALAMRRRLLEEEHPYIIKSLHSLAVLYIEQGEVKKATPLVEEIIERKKKQPGEEHIEVTTELNVLATLYEVQGMYGKAEQLYQQIWRSKRK